MWLFGKEPPPTPLAGDPRVALVSIRIYWLPPTFSLGPSPTFSPCFPNLSLSLTQLDFLPRQHSSSDCSSNHHPPQTHTFSNKCTQFLITPLNPPPSFASFLHLPVEVGCVEGALLHTGRKVGQDYFCWLVPSEACVACVHICVCVCDEAWERVGMQTG